MRSSAAIGLVLIGGGVVATAVTFPHRCTDPLTGQSIACPGGTSGTGGGFSRTSSSSIGGTSSSSSVSRGGFGGAGASASAGS